MNYIAFLYKDEDIGSKDKDDGFNVIIPDVEGTYTCGDNFIHSVQMAKEVLDLNLEDLNILPKANALEYFTPKKLKQLDIPLNAVPQVIEHNLLKKKRITVNLNLRALKSIDEYMKSHNLKNRSEFLEESALKIVSS